MIQNIIMMMGNTRYVILDVRFFGQVKFILIGNKLYAAPHRSNIPGSANSRMNWKNRSGNNSFAGMPYTQSDGIHALFEI